MSKKVKWNKLEICLLIIFGLIFIVSMITSFKYLLTPNPYEDIDRSWLASNGRENYKKYCAFEDDKWSKFAISLTIMCGSGACLLIPYCMILGK